MPEQPAKKAKTSSREIRTRKNPERLGIEANDNNDDELFDEIDNREQRRESETVEAVSASTQCKQNDPAVSIVASVNTDANNNQHLNVLTPGERILYEEIMRLKKEVTVLQRAVVGFEVTLGEKRSAADTIEFQKVGDDELQSLGLPLTNEADFKEFEKKIDEKGIFYGSGKK